MFNKKYVYRYNTLCKLLFVKKKGKHGLAKNSSNKNTVNKISNFKQKTQYR